MRKFRETELVLATHNQGKVREISDLLRPYVDTFYSAGDLGLSEPEETGLTFAENARLKALSAAKESGKPALSDDSGLSVEALGGDPGVYSARWAVPPGETERDFDYAMARVHEAIGDHPNRNAAFICVLALAWPDGHVETFEGRVQGTIIWPARGEKGFGYDPIFQPAGYDITFAEMEPEKKHLISHRADAFQKLVRSCLEADAA